MFKKTEKNKAIKEKIITEYIIIKDQHSEEGLAMEVNYYINDGWQPLGGLCLWAPKSAKERFDDIINFDKNTCQELDDFKSGGFYQAMVKYEK